MPTAGAPRWAELARLSRTICRWEAQLLAWHTTSLTNGPTEAVNLLVIRPGIPGGSVAWK